MLFGAKRIFEIILPVKSNLNFKVKLSVSQTVIILAFVEMLAKNFPSGEKSIEK